MRNLGKMSWIRDSTLNWIQLLCVKVVKSGTLPKHIAFIMDGNRRYAQKNNVQKFVGHSHGFEKLADTLQWCLDLGIAEVTVYAFSIENFKRSQEEVDALMELSRQKFQRLLSEKDKLMELGVCIRVIGNLALLPQDIQKLIAQAMILTKDNKKAFLNVAFAYTAREEMAQAVQTVVSGVEHGTLQLSDVTQQLLANCLYTSASPDPQLLIRTSGEVRLSDYLLWQASCSCIYFADILWPEFSIWHLLAAILKYQRSYNQLLPVRLADDMANGSLSERSRLFSTHLAASRFTSLEELSRSVA